MKWFTFILSFSIYANICYPVQELTQELKTRVNYTEKTTEGKVIAILDTGIDLNNTYLKDRTLKDKNGDIVGLDLNNNNFKDSNGHGTHIASIITMLNPMNKIVPIAYYDSNDSGVESINKFIKGLEFVSEHPEIQILNISAGGNNFDAREMKAIKKILENGTIIISAAGNDSETISKFDEKESFVTRLRNKVKNNYYFPASYGFHGLISVMNVDINGNPVESSNRGEFISTGYIGNDIPAYDNNCNKILLSGSSQSTAIVTGIISGWSKTEVSYIEKRLKDFGKVRKISNYTIFE